MVGQTFFDRHSRFLQSSQVGAWPVRLNARYDAIIAHNADLLSGARVLDLASHDGRWSLAALEAGALHVTGVEVRSELVELTRATFAHYGISSERYSLVNDDVFEALRKVDDSFDVVFCLGFLYHTTRHVELFESVARLGIPSLIIDSMVVDRVEAQATIVEERIDHPANGYSEFDKGTGKVLVGIPSRAAMELYLRHYAFSFEYFDWQRLISAKGLPYALDRPHDATNPVGDYAKGERVTILARRKRTA